MSSLRVRLLTTLSLVALAACGTDATAPADARSAEVRRPSFLLANNESYRELSYTTDAAGNTTIVAELAAGAIYLADGTYTSVASVTVKSVIPAWNPEPLPAGTDPSSVAPCITSTVQKTETTAGWRANVKKSGGCDREIVVELENRSTRQKATFKFLMVYGKTTIDHGLVR